MSFIFLSNIFLHLILDTVVGKIEWLYPFSEKSFYLFEVPPVYDFWVYNFIFHWTFLIEIFIMGWWIKIILEYRKKRNLEKLSQDVAEAREDIKTGRVYSEAEVYKNL